MKHRDLFTLNPSCTFLNHGSYGACPRPIQDAQRQWRQQMEAQPVHFMQRILPEALDQARGIAAQFIGAEPASVAFVRNATSGVNAVLSSLRFAAGDRILTTSHRYEAVGNALTYTAKKTGAIIDTVDIPVPLSDPAIVVERLAAAITEKTRLLVIDQISSATALVMPIDAIARLAERHGCLLLVDGAHAPGHLELNVESMGVDFWVGNLHKWPCAPKGCALIWVNSKHRDGLHPAIISNFYGQGFHAEFDWCGTEDPSPWLCAPDAIALHEGTFGGATFRAQNRALAAQATDILCEITGGVPVAGHASLRCALGAVLLDSPAGDLYAQLSARNIEVPIIEWGGQTIIRVSAFSAYNHIEQYRTLAHNAVEILAARA